MLNVGSTFYTVYFINFIFWLYQKLILWTTELVFDKIKELKKDETKGITVIDQTKEEEEQK